MRKGTLVLLVAAFAACLVSESEAQTDGQIIVHRTSSIGFGNGGYFGGSCGNPWIYGPWTQTLGFIPTPPYYSLYPPVYYSHNVYRPYGMSPFPVTSYQPGTSVNYTTKTQYLFRINKGIANHWDRESINRFVPLDERPVPFTRMRYAPFACAAILVDRFR